MREGIVLVLLIFFAVEDMKKKSLSLFLLAAAFGVALLLRFLWLGDMAAGAAGFVSGLMVCAAGKLSRGQIGMGDGFLLTVTGVLLGFWKNMELFLAALFLCAVFAAGALVFKKKGRGYRVPFVPFLAGAQLFRMLVL